MFSYVWPLATVIFANTMYQICAKSLPGDLNPLASLTLTYIVSAIVSLILFFVTVRNGNLLQEYSKINWTTVMLGVAIVFLEVGMIYCYKAGWPVSTLMIVQCAILAIVMLFVGRFIYSEAITTNKLLGLAICLVGLYFINK